MDPPDLARQLERLLGRDVIEAVRVGGQHGVAHHRVVLADGRVVFAKTAADGSDRRAAPPDGPAAWLAAEARGLRWLAETGAVGVPEVLGWNEQTLAIAWLPEGRADRRSAERFGRELARMHAAGAASFGAPWPAFIAGLPLGDERASAWPEWYAGQRLAPFARRARQAGALTGADVRLIEQVAARIADLAGPAEPPSRIHGDCWSGNVLWSGGRGWLIDPAAHGGHRESDLAMLALFGAPYLDPIIGAYQEVTPLAAGWRGRVPLHQLHPLLVHVCLFGAAYRDGLLAAARQALSA